MFIDRTLKPYYFLYYFHITGILPNKTKNPTSPTEQKGNAMNETLAIINQCLAQYPEESMRICSDIVAGVVDAVDEMEDIHMDDMDESYNMLYRNIMKNHIAYKNITSRLAAITLAKVFIEQFDHVPAASLPHIESEEPIITWFPDY